MEKEIEILEEQNITSILFIVSIVISMLLTYNEKQMKLHQKPLFSPNTDQYINLFNRILALSILAYILYLNYQNYQIGKQKERNIAPLRHQIVASTLSTIAGLIVLYVVIENWDESPNITTIENPTF